MINECGAIGGMRIGECNRSTQTKSAQVLLCPSRIAHYLTWDRTRAATVEGRVVTPFSKGKIGNSWDKWLFFVNVNEYPGLNEVNHRKSKFMSLLQEMDE
jgi:hypothetical protein